MADLRPRSRKVFGCGEVFQQGKEASAGEDDREPAGRRGCSAKEIVRHTRNAAGDCRDPGLSKVFSGSLDKAAPKGAALPDLTPRPYYSPRTLRTFSSVTGEMTANSVMIPVMYLAGVTSKAGL